MIKKTFPKLFENELDFDFRLDMQRIDTVWDFEESLIKPYAQGKKMFYRGERINSADRPLLPSLFRDKEFLFQSSHRVNMIDSAFLCRFYKKMEEYYRVYRDVIGAFDEGNMYPFLSFTQHYLGISPLIDFSKSPYPALSFALKDRTEYPEDILIYTLELNDSRDYTDSLDVANYWLQDYSVLVFRDVTVRELENPLDMLADQRLVYETAKGKNLFELNTPKAKLIDVPTNDLMRFQQGVFLLLNDFSLMGKSYLTKKIRDDFNIKKWLINKSICPDLLDMLLQKHPYYAYQNIMDLPAVAEKIKENMQLKR